jgi:two-component system response regulator CpxR
MAINPQLSVDIAPRLHGAARRTTVDAAMPLRLLLVSDDAQLRTLLSQFLSAHGYSVIAESNALPRGRAACCDAAIVDAGKTQLEAARSLRDLRELQRAARVPTVALAAPRRGADSESLWQRVDVVLDKPLDPRKLLLVLRGLFARGARAAAAEQQALTAGPLTLQSLLSSLAIGTREVALTGVETRILRELMLAAGTTVPRDRLARCGSPPGWSPDDRTLDTHVKRLRRKLGTDCGGRTPIRTVRGIGYLLLADWRPSG